MKEKEIILKDKGPKSSEEDYTTLGVSEKQRNFEKSILPEGSSKDALRKAILDSNVEGFDDRNQKSLIRKLLKSGGNIQGLLTLIKTNHGDYFNKAIGTWARKRGRNFELQVCKIFEEILKQKENSGLIYRTPIERCGTQLYDLVLYLNSKVPVFIECKAGGASEKGGFLVIDFQSRALKNYDQREDLIENLLENTGAPYWFAFPEEEGIVLIPKRYIVKDKNKVKIPLDLTFKINDKTPLGSIHEFYEKEIKK